MLHRITDHPVLTFDCYGTLIDWEGGIWEALQPLLRTRPDQVFDRAHVIATFNHFEGLQQAATPTLVYPKVLEQVHHSLAAHLGLESSDPLDQAFGASVPQWPAFSDSCAALLFLSDHFDLVILSNVDRAGFAASNELLGVEFDAIYTAEEIGSYKPEQANFRYLIEHLACDLGHEKNEILHIAESIRHDHVPARQIGLHNVWIDRNRLSDTLKSGLPAYENLFFSMAELVTAVTRELVGA